MNASVEMQVRLRVDLSQCEIEPGETPEDAAERVLHEAAEVFDVDVLSVESYL